MYVTTNLQVESFMIRNADTLLPFRYKLYEFMRLFPDLVYNEQSVLYVQKTCYLSKYRTAHICTALPLIRLSIQFIYIIVKFVKLHNGTTTHCVFFYNKINNLFIFDTYQNTCISKLNALFIFCTYYNRGSYFVRGWSLMWT